LANTVVAAINSKSIGKRIGLSRTSTKRIFYSIHCPLTCKDQGRLCNQIGAGIIRHQHSWSRQNDRLHVDADLVSRVTQVRRPAHIDSAAAGWNDQGLCHWSKRSQPGFAERADFQGSRTSGLPGAFLACLFAPKGTPEPILDKLTAALDHPQALVGVR